MALNIKDPETEALVAEVAELTGDTKTGAVRSAMRKRRDELRRSGAVRTGSRGRAVLENEIWPMLGISEEQEPITKAERESILGYGPGGV